MPLYLGAYDPAVTATYQKNLGYTIGALNVDPAVLAGVQMQYLNLWSTLASKIGNDDLYTAALALIDNDTYIYPGTGFSVRPTWLADPNKWAAWQGAAQQFKPLTINMANANIAAAQDAAEALAPWLNALDITYNITSVLALPYTAAKDVLNLFNDENYNKVKDAASWLTTAAVIGAGVFAYYTFVHKKG